MRFLLNSYAEIIDDCNKPERGDASWTGGKIEITDTTTHNIKLKEMKNLWSLQLSCIEGN